MEIRLIISSAYGLFSPLGSRPEYCPAGSLVCSDDSSAIALVELFGARSTQLRDDLKRCNSMNNYNDRTNLVVSLYDDTVYALHLALYCVQQMGNDNSYDQGEKLRGIDCSYVQYFGVWIDLNNDGVFDENTERILPTNWYEDGQRTTQYDLNIAIPKIDGRVYFSEQHRMRIVMTQDERNRKPCYSTGYGEVRDYTVQIIPKPMY